MAEIDELRTEIEYLKATLDIAGAALGVEIERRRRWHREATDRRNNLMRMTADRDDLLEKYEAVAADLRQFRLLGDAVVDLCWKATPTGATTDGDVSAYILPKGTVHRLIGAAQGAGIPASFRARVDPVAAAYTLAAEVRDELVAAKESTLRPTTEGGQ